MEGRDSLKNRESAVVGREGGREGKEGREGGREGRRWGEVKCTCKKIQSDLTKN